MNWQRREMLFSEFAEKLQSPVRSQETQAEYLKLPKSEQDDLKDVGGFVGGALRGRRRKANHVLSRDLITLDFDTIGPGMIDEVIDKVRSLGAAYVIYSTRKHSPERPRLRIILPTDRSMDVDEYEPVARRIAEHIGMAMADPTTFEASRLMYWPSCSRDGDYVYVCGDAPFLSADKVLSTYDDWREVSSWPTAPGEDTHARKTLVKQEDPLEKRGLIGAFCRAYDIEGAMAAFIPQAYDEAKEPGRYTYLEGSTTGGAVIYEDGKFLYSHHATDPCGGKLVNAWDLVRLHKFHDLDDDAKEGTPVTALPSTTAMKELARRDDKVVELLNDEKQDQAEAFFEAIGQEDSSPDEDAADDGAWRKQLTKNGSGAYEKSIANIVTVLAGDIRFKGRIYLDEFANRGMVTLPLPWESGEGARMWTDTDDAQLALRLEKEYGITGPAKIETALKVVGFNNRRNEVADFIKNCKWDGNQRIHTLLRDYLGADQSVYTAEIMRKALVAAIARALSSEGVKYDTMIVFKGPQGIGKSTFLSRLGMRWFSDSLYSFEGKEAAELIQGTLINEVGELSAMTKTETEIVKQFLSKTHDIYREAYGKRTNKYPRRCIFFGSTNSEEFLKDVTGNRRFWPVRVGEVTPRKSIWDDMDEEEVAQIWAEAYTYYLLGEDLERLSVKAQEIAEAMQDEFRETNPKEGAIQAFLEKKIPPNWYEMQVRDQRAYLHGAFKVDDPSTLVRREKVCIPEIWQVLLQGELKNMRRRDSIEISNVLTSIKGWKRNRSVRRYGNFGIQKGYERVSNNQYIDESVLSE